MPLNPYVIKHDNADSAGDKDVTYSDLGKEGGDLEDYDGVEEWYPGNIVYNESGNQVLYRMWRVSTKNRYGVEVRIRDEAEELINTPGVCE
jgi:hypothetical protein